MIRRRALTARRPAGLYPNWRWWVNQPDPIAAYIREFELLNHLVRTV